MDPIFSCLSNFAFPISSDFTHMDDIVHGQADGNAGDSRSFGRLKHRPDRFPQTRVQPEA